MVTIMSLPLLTMLQIRPAMAVDLGSGPGRVIPKNYNIGICCFSTKHAALKIKSKDWLAQNQNNVSEWSDMCSRKL